LFYCERIKLAGSKITKLSDSDPVVDINPTKTNAKDSLATAEKKIGTFTAFRTLNFRFLFTNQVISQAGNWIQQYTLNYLVYKLTGTGAALGTLSTIRSVTSLGMIPVAGVLTDRVERRKLMMITNAWLFIVTLMFALILIYGRTQVSYLFVFGFLVGLTYTIDATVKQVVIFDLIPRNVTPNAIALLLTGSAMMRSVGPAIGGFLILWKGPGGNLLVQAFAYVLIAISIMQLRFPAQRHELKRTSAVQNIKEG
jgi:MFS family permease